MNPVAAIRETLCRKYHILCGIRTTRDEHDPATEAPVRTPQDTVPSYNDEDVSERFRHAIDDYFAADD